MFELRPWMKTVVLAICIGPGLLVFGFLYAILSLFFKIEARTEFFLALSMLITALIYIICGAVAFIGYNSIIGLIPILLLLIVTIQVKCGGP